MPYSKKEWAELQKVGCITSDDFRKEFKKDLTSHYLLFGEEDYLKTRYLAEMRKLYCGDPSFRDFNDIRMEFDTINWEDLPDLLSAMPMMAEHCILSVSSFSPNTLRNEKAEFSAIADAVHSVGTFDGNALVLIAPDGAVTLEEIKSLSENVKPVYFPKAEGSTLCTWMRAHFKAGGVEVEDDFLRWMQSYCSHSMFILDGEIRKLCAYLKYNHIKTPTREIAEKVLCRVQETGLYDFSEAIQLRQTERALKILQDKKLKQEDPLVLLGEIIGCYCDMVAVQHLADRGLSNEEIGKQLKKHSYVVSKYREALYKMEKGDLKRGLDAIVSAEYNIKSGTVGTNDAKYEELEKLICSL